MDNKKTILLITLFFVAIGVLAYQIYPTIKLQHTVSQMKFKSDNQPVSKNIQSPQNKKDENKDKQVDKKDETLSESNKQKNDINTNDDTDDNSNSSDQNEFINITSEDCNEGCGQFEDEEDNKYCREVCGLDSETNETVAECDKLSDLEKDYCWKDKAISEKNFKTCKKIKDKKIKQTCENRITEDILDSE